MGAPSRLSGIPPTRSPPPLVIPPAVSASPPDQRPARPAPHQTGRSTPIEQHQCPASAPERKQARSSEAERQGAGLFPWRQSPGWAPDRLTGSELLASFGVFGVFGVLIRKHQKPKTQQRRGLELWSLVFLVLFGKDSNQGKRGQCS